MSRIRLALATALLLISGPALAAVVLASSISGDSSVSDCGGQFETVYVEDLPEEAWLDEPVMLYVCN